MADAREAASVAVQTALVDVLSGIGVAVFTVMPQAVDGGSDAVFPHIHIDEPILGSFDTMTGDGHDIIQRIHVRWRGGSNLPGKRLQAEIYDLLHHGTLVMEGWTLILMAQDQVFVTRMPDGSFDGINEFRLIVQKT